MPKSYNCSKLTKYTKTPNTQVTQENNSETKKKTRGVTRMSLTKVDEQKKDMMWSSLSVCFLLFFNILTKDSILSVQVEEGVGSHACTPSHVFTSQSQHGSVPMIQDMSQFEYTRFHLLHWYPDDDSKDQIVVESRISNTNLKNKIHNMPLGRCYWRVWIDAVH
ncbi:hypothetical protein ACOSQ3_014078 [Xanthoceras sorbifolium]